MGTQGDIGSATSIVADRAARIQERLARTTSLPEQLSSRQSASATRAASPSLASLGGRLWAAVQGQAPPASTRQTLPPRIADRASRMQAALSKVNCGSTSSHPEDSRARLVQAVAAYSN